jgi:putative heme-binding domain-containing protein
MKNIAFLFLGLTYTVSSFCQPKTYKTQDAASGKPLFNSNCAVCHGPGGDNVPGVDLLHGKFRRVSSDDDIVRVIQNGIPGTGMPSANIPEFQARLIVAYLRTQAIEASRITSSPAEIAQGRSIFEGKGGCLQCHRVMGRGSRSGPDLSEIGAYRLSTELRTSLVDPDAEILPPNRTIHAVTSDGQKVGGTLLNEDTFSLQIITADERLTNLSKSKLRDWGFDEKSPMPSYEGRLTQQEIADVVNYLVSLKGVKTE